jgi:hypothetical protein
MGTEGPILHPHTYIRLVCIFFTRDGTLIIHRWTRHYMLIINLSLAKKSADPPYLTFRIIYPSIQFISSSRPIMRDILWSLHKNKKFFEIPGSFCQPKLLFPQHRLELESRHVTYLGIEAPGLLRGLAFCSRDHHSIVFRVRRYLAYKIHPYHIFKVGIRVTSGRAQRLALRPV